MTFEWHRNTTVTNWRKMFNGTAAKRLQCVHLSDILPKKVETSRKSRHPKHNKDSSLLNYYRPISLLDILGKVFEESLEECLRTFSFDNSIIPSSKFDFRRSRSSISSTESPGLLKTVKGQTLLTWRSF